MSLIKIHFFLHLLLVGFGDIGKVSAVVYAAQNKDTSNTGLHWKQDVMNMTKVNTDGLLFIRMIKLKVQEG